MTPQGVSCMQRSMRQHESKGRRIAPLRLRRADRPRLPLSREPTLDPNLQRGVALGFACRSGNMIHSALGCPCTCATVSRGPFDLPKNALDPLTRETFQSLQRAFTLLTQKYCAVWTDLRVIAWDPNLTSSSSTTRISSELAASSWPLAWLLRCVTSSTPAGRGSGCCCLDGGGNACGGMSRAGGCSAGGPAALYATPAQ